MSLLAVHLLVRHLINSCFPTETAKLSKLVFMKLTESYELAVNKKLNYGKLIIRYIGHHLPQCSILSFFLSLIYNYFMKMTAIMKKAKMLPLAVKIGIGILVILLIMILFLLFSKTNGQKSKSSAGAGSELNQNSSPGSTAGQASVDSDNRDSLPDLAEAIARLSREMADPDREAFIEDFWRWIFGEAGIPERFARKVAASALESPAFIMELLEVLQQDPYTYFLVDKQHALSLDYEPGDLVPLTGGSYRLSRDGLMLRGIAAQALREMAAAAAAEGIVLTVGSSYRSAAYQAQVYEREVKTHGQEIADRQSARPGNSQHQLGLALDFSPIDDAFAKTPASQWLLRNAGRYGFSLSYPDGYEEVTGYRWESWHYRYVGRDLTVFTDNYFDGIQQYALQFIRAWQDQAGG